MKGVLNLRNHFISLRTSLAPFHNSILKYRISLKVCILVFFYLLHPQSHISISKAANDTLVENSLITLISLFSCRIFFFAHLSIKYFNSNKTAPSQALFSYSKFSPLFWYLPANTNIYSIGTLFFSHPFLMIINQIVITPCYIFVD